MSNSMKIIKALPKLPFSIGKLAWGIIIFNAMMMVLDQIYNNEFMFFIIIYPNCIALLYMFRSPFTGQIPRLILEKGYLKDFLYRRDYVGDILDEREKIILLKSIGITYIATLLIMALLLFALYSLHLTMDISINVTLTMCIAYFYIIMLLPTAIAETLNNRGSENDL